MSFDDPIEAGNWTRERVLGSGGFGVVTLWKNGESNEMIALKKCRVGTDALLTAKHKERWAKEVEIMHRLCHPNVVKALQLPIELSILRSELPMLCMEYCSKGDLRQVLNRSENCCGLREYDVRSLISNVKDAVQYLHKNKITHRDLKPENIVLQEVDGIVVYKLIDLGYAKELDQSSVCTSFVGTLQYLAPELFMSQTYTYSVDYWSLGLVSHEVITGVRPFLPSMTPAEWMSKVREKSPDDICVYQDDDENIVFSQQLFQKITYPCKCLKSQIEVWLKCALQWDPKRRGRHPQGTSSNIIVFDLLSDILNKMILKVYCAAAYKELSYEITDETTVGSVLHWVARDTSLPAKSLEVLSPKGAYVKESDEAKVYWTQKMVQTSNSQDHGAMLYVYRKGDLHIPEVKPSIPSSVCKMIQQPQAIVKYSVQKRMWAHSVFFLQQERHLFSSFLLAYSVKVSYILSCKNELLDLTQVSNLHLQRIGAQLELIKDMITFDEQQLQELGYEKSFKKMHQGWQSLYGRTKKLELELQRIISAVNEVHKIHLCRMKDIQSFDSLLSSALKCYDSLKRRPKEVRQIPSHSMEMLKIIYNSLKIRDQLLREDKFQKHLSEVVLRDTEINELMPSLKSVEFDCRQLQNAIKEWQVERQRQLWDHIVQFKRKLSQTQDGLNTAVKTPAHLSSLNNSLNDGVHHPLFDKPPKHFISLPLPHQEFESVVQDNSRLRHMTVDMMNQSFIKMEEVLQDELDWSWMNSG